MSNLTDFISGIDKNFGADGGGALQNYSPEPPQINDATINYYDINKYHPLLNGNLNMLPYSLTADGLTFDSRWAFCNNVYVDSTTAVTQSGSFLGIQAKELFLNGTISVGKPGNGFSGHSNSVGTNLMGTSWDFMPKGGKGGNGYHLNSNSKWVSDPAKASIVGGSSGGGAAAPARGGAGGGLVLLIADSIYGLGTINAIGGNGTKFDDNYGGGGGGGILILLTKAWSGSISLNVNGGSGPYNHNGKVGSYVILRMESDSSLTLMVHSENGVSAPLNGQTPVFGKFANVPYDATTPLTPSSVTAGTPISIAVAGSATVDSRAIHGTSESPYLTYTSSDTGVATVDGDGIVTGVASGSCTITATSVIDNTKTNTTSVTVS